MPLSLSSLFASRRNKLIAAGIAAVVVLGGIALAVVVRGGGDEPAATTTTTSITTTTEPTTTTTTAPPVAPLTRLPADPAVIGRTALVVKIDNVEPRARPQVGINEADVVFEERVEGSVTRLLAVFHSTDAAPVGPVRSARTSDIGVLSMLNRPFFAWSGANDFFVARIRQANLIDVGYDAASSHYYRDGGRPRPYNLMLRSTADIMALPAEGSGPPAPLFTYRAPDQQPAHLEPAAGVNITYGTSAGSAPVDYRWNGSGWERSQQGTPHVDAAGAQVAPANVVVQFTPYASSGVNDQFGNPIPEAQLVGEGEAWVFTAGGVVVGRWHKPSLEAITTYTDVDGNPIGLTPGRTWVALAPPGSATRF